MFRKWIKDDDAEHNKAKAKEAAFFKELDANIELVRSNLNLVAKKSAGPQHFELIKTVPVWSLYESFCCSDESLPLQCFVIRYVTSVKVGRTTHSGGDFYLAGVLSLKRTYPHTIAYPETLAEKLSELFVNSEVDFSNNKKFSRRFYTLTKDQQLLKELIADKNLDELSKFRNLELELKENECFFRPGRKPVTRREANSFCELARAIYKAFD